MKSEYLDLLPEPFQRMVAEVESAIGKEISVRAAAPTDPDFVRSSDLLHCQCAIDESGFVAEVISPSRDIKPHNLAHEVMHMHRNLVQQVERLAPRIEDGGIPELISWSIDNDLEHVFIVPVELEHFPEALPFWEESFRQQLEFVKNQPHISSLPAERAVLVRFDMLRSFVAIRLILPSQWPGLQEYLDVLEYQGLMRDANNLIEKVQKQSCRKTDWIATILRFGKFDPSAFVIARYDTATGSEIKRPVPMM